MKFNKLGTVPRILYKIESEYEMSTVKKNDFERMWGTN